MATSNHLGVPGRTLHSNIIPPDYEQSLISWLDTQPWSTTLNRRTQQYGYTYDYVSRIIRPSDNPLHGKVLELAEWLNDSQIMVPDQCIVNEYNRDQGIGAHIDLLGFGPRIISLSVGADTNFIFKNYQTKESVTLDVPSRSILIMDGDARYIWTHEIPKRITITVDGKRMTKPGDYRRISLTFRTVPSGS